jgi:hypothetical protein
MTDTSLVLYCPHKIAALDNAAIYIKIVGSTDGMTADWSHLPHEFLAKVSATLQQFEIPLYCYYRYTRLLHIGP